jgi:hypothetical protein
LAAKLRAQIQRIDENMIQAEAAALPGLGDSLMHPLVKAGSGAEAAPPVPAPAPAPPAPAAPPRIMPVPNRMISIEAGLGSQSAALPPMPPTDEPMAQDPLAALQEEPMPPHDALSALQLGQDPSSESFNALGFAASQGMFDYGVAPMDDAFIGDFLRYWPAQGMLADAVQEGSPFTGTGM